MQSSPSNPCTFVSLLLRHVHRGVAAGDMRCTRAPLHRMNSRLDGKKDGSSHLHAVQVGDRLCY
jgi:hypothetical protein